MPRFIVISERGEFVETGFNGVPAFFTDQETAQARAEEKSDANYGRNWYVAELVSVSRSRGVTTSSLRASDYPAQAEEEQAVFQEAVKLVQEASDNLKETFNVPGGQLQGRGHL